MIGVLLDTTAQHNSKQVKCDMKLTIERRRMIYKVKPIPLKRSFYTLVHTNHIF